MTLFMSVLIMLVFGLAGNNPPPETGRVGGTIVEAKSGKPVVGAVAIVGEDRFGGVSNDTGKFLIAGIPPGEYLFRVECRCYKPWILYHLKVNSGKTTELKISLLDPTQIPADSVGVHHFLQLFDPDSLKHAR